MKKICLFLITMTVVFTGVNILKADCETAKEMGESLIIVSSTATLKDEDTILKIVMPSDEIYVEISNNYNDEKNKLYIQDGDENGILSLTSPDKYTNIRYEINVYYADSNCGIKAFKTYSLETGIYNKFSDAEACRDHSNLNVCKNTYDSEDIEKYYNEENISEENLENIIEKEINATNKESKSIIDIVKEYYLYVIIPILVISLAYIIVIISVKRRKKIKDEQI